LPFYSATSEDSSDVDFNYKDNPKKVLTGDIFLSNWPKKHIENNVLFIPATADLELAGDNRIVNFS